jgi:hypothetical protein
MALPPFTEAQSSAFSGYHIDPDARALTVQFKDGAVWRYDDVALERLTAFEGSDSKGAYFMRQIRPHHKGVRVHG